MTNPDDQSRAAFEAWAKSREFTIGDRVLVLCNDEGYVGQVGEITHVFPSGRCMVAFGKITILNLPPEVLSHEVSD